MVCLCMCVYYSSTNAQCPLPSGLILAGTSSSTAQLAWAPAPADSFLLRYYDLTDSIYLFKTISNGTATSTTLTNLYPNTTYAWQIRTWCNNGTSGAYQSSPELFTTDAQTVYCVTPNDHYSTNITENSAELFWNPYINADSFLVRYAELGTTNYTWVTLPGNTHNAVINGLIPDTEYEWVVRCVCAGNPSQAYSRVRTFRTQSLACNPPDVSFFTSTGVTSSEATVGWNAIPSASSYVVRYAVRFSGNWITAPSTNLTELLSGLISSTWYEFQILSICSGDSSAWSQSGIFQTLSNTISLTRGPYLQQSTESSIFIRWRTNIPCDSKIDFGTDPLHLNLSTTSTTQTTEHVVQLINLNKNTKYYYAIGSSGTKLQGDLENYFVTNPHVGSTDSVRIWVIGDFGRSSTAQRLVRDSYEAYTGTKHTNLWLWLGDNAYNDGTDSEYQTKVFDEYPKQFKKWVTWPTSGNHDLHSANSNNLTGPYYDNFTMPMHGEAGGVPSGTEAYYSFNYANIHFVCLESYGSNFRSATGDMANWLHADLSANTQTFTVVYFHHPPYSKGSHDSDAETELIQMRTNIVPILENYKVDLVLAGHSHSYERTMMLHGHYGNSNTFNVSTMTTDAGSGTFPNSYVKNGTGSFGTVYVVCGTSGYAGSTMSDWPHDAMYEYTVNHYGSLVIDVKGNQLNCKYLTSSGAIRDEFTIIKPGFPTGLIDGQSVVATRTNFKIWPNPILQHASIEYYLSKASKVSFEVIDLAGRQVIQFGDGIEKTAGTHTMNFPVKDAQLPKGIYFIRMKAGLETKTRKIVFD
ncbi:MAG TPA: fibronectin type III domain-containing protein [Bacteroidia bacterium]|nr:fibronectin type III domain-containing protein [Bacteroidia bacterium]